MGNRQSPQTDIDIAHQYTPIRPERGGILLKDNHSSNTFLLRQLTFPNEIPYLRQRDRLETEQARGPQQHLLAVRKLKTHTVEGVCSTTHKLLAIYQYPTLTLRDQLLERSHSGKRFDQQELMSIALCCAEALQVSHALSLSCREVFITEDGEIKVIHPDMQQEGLRMQCTAGTLYAPEKMKNFNRFDSAIGLQREAVFSAGMTLLQSALLQPDLNCYDYTNTRFIQSRLEDLLGTVRSLFSSNFMDLLEGVLDINPAKRMTLQEMDYCIDEYWDKSEAASRGQSARAILASERERGALRELPTVQSTQQESVGRKAVSREERATSGGGVWSGTSGMGSVTCMSAESTRQNENIYTDPRLLEWIRQDVSVRASFKPSQSRLKQSQDNAFQLIQELQIKKSLKASRSSDVRSSAGGRRVSFPASQVCSARLEEEDGVFQGYTFNGLKHGWGRMTYSEGGYYEGEFKEGEISGKGVLYYENGSKAYQGEWLKGAFHGRGTIYNQCPVELGEGFDGRDFDEMGEGWVKYEGSFEEDSRCGIGRLQLVGGGKWQGQFEGDMLQGQGVYEGEDGKIIRGKWESNRLVQVINQ